MDCVLPVSLIQTPRGRWSLSGVASDGQEHSELHQFGIFSCWANAYALSAGEAPGWPGSAEAG